ncbi:porin family protein [Winogradskyella ouciana]|uniref:porin family protein n=1 Tax=Winogradskyella ouciana TaxID=2608631 RepID=UPI003D2BD30D
MKKITLSAIMAFFSVIAINAQDETTASADQQFGLKAGYSSIISKVKVDGASGSDNVSGFYIGAFAEIELGDKFSLQPEITFANYSQDGESSSVLLIPILTKFKANNELGLYAGPQLDYLLNEEDAEGLKRVGLGLAIGASYDISDDVFIDTRYTFGISDRLDGDLEGFEDFNVKAKFNYFQVGLGYRF